MSDIAHQLETVRQRIATATQAAKRPTDAVRLLAVSKTFPAEDVRVAYAAGQRAFGENYVQESLDKIATLDDLRATVEWHFIGPLQSNKTRQVAGAFDWVHSVDRLKIAARLSEQRPTHLPPLNICVQVNISGEDSKSGVLPAECLALLHEIAALPRLTLRGLMAIPATATGLDAQRAPHRALKMLMSEAQGAGLDLDTLSCGMSDDLEAAVLEGATLVRVGTAIFGNRTYGTAASAATPASPASASTPSISP